MDPYCATIVRATDTVPFMKVDGVIVTEQGVTFGIVLVEPQAIRSLSGADIIRSYCRSHISDFSGVPLILAARDDDGELTFQGKPDIVHLVASIPSEQIAWTTFNVS